MTARLASLSPRAQGAVVAGVLFVVVLLGYFVVISPKRSTAADLKKQTAAVQKQIDQNRSMPSRSTSSMTDFVAEFFILRS